MSLLEVSRAFVSYGRVQVLHDVSFEVEAGEVVALLGANGAGKSTALRTISGLLRCAPGGRINFDGNSITDSSPEAISRAGIAHVPEGRRIFPGLSVMDNLLMGASNRGRLPRRQLRADVDDVLGLFPGLQKFVGALGWTLSGGQQQMLALGRGLMSQPRLLLLDEPSLGLAPVIVDQVFAVIATLKERGSTILVVEQNATLALSVSDRAYVLETGRTALNGRSSELLGNVAVGRAYLGISAELEEASANRSPAPGLPPDEKRT